MNLIIDQGNTQIKIGVFDKWQLVYSDSYNILDKNTLLSLRHKYNISRCIFSSVIKENTNRLLTALKDIFPGYISLSHNMPLPFVINYKTPETLGKDRIAVVAGAQSLHPGKDILIIDAGTAVTYELLTGNGIYQGGNISPGLQIRYKALHNFTSQLPLLNIDEQNNIIGRSTNEAIHSGVQYGLLFEIKGYIRQLKKRYPEIVVLFTGGDADFFVKKLKKRIFVHPNLVLIGLNRILEYNDKLK
ncbi:MAG: type III pantothenate kinase [Chlorobi bacterium]|nr:type III pantothenate kinase [Chlorobiota bacterium]